MTKSTILKIRIFLYLIIFLIVSFFIYKAIVPSGEIEYIFNFNKENSFISKLSPDERLDFGNKKIKNKIIANPVYFNLKTPRTFNSAEISIRYKNKNVPLVEGGFLVDKTLWRYDLKPFQNKLLDQLSLVWDKETKDNLLILKRPKTASTTFNCNFLNNDEFGQDISSLATYNYNLSIPYILKNYENKNQELKSLDNFHSLRGAWQFYTYIKDEDLNFNFSFRDLNLNKDADQIELFLFYEGELIDSKTLDDDGINLDTGELRKDRDISINLKNLPEGLYKLELKVNDDILTTDIKTSQSKIVFIHKINLFKENKVDLKVFTDSNKLQLTTIYPDSLQEFIVNKDVFNLEETYHQFQIDLKNNFSTSSLKEVQLKKDGIVLSGDGLFSFSQFNFFNPQIKKAVFGLKINEQNINCIIADYKGAQKKGDDYFVHLNFDLKKAYREDGKYSFLISAPDLKSDDNLDDYLEIEEIKIKLKGKSLRKKINEIFKK